MGWEGLQNTSCCDALLLFFGGIFFRNSMFPSIIYMDYQLLLLICILIFFYPSHHHNLLRTLFIETEAGGIIFGKIKQAQFQTKLGCTPHFVPPNSELIFFFSNCIAILKYVSSRESVVQTSIFPRPPYC